MKKKTIIILVILLVIVVSSAWRFCPCGKEKTFSWSDNLSEIKVIIKEAKEGNKLLSEQLRSVQIVRESDLTGDGIPEALILTGTGGAYTEDLALFILKDDKPALAKFIDENGDRRSIIFTEGSSVRNGSKIDWQPENKIIYTTSWSLNFNGTLDDCRADAYKYDNNKQAFVYDQNLSDSLGQEFCASLSTSL